MSSGVLVPALCAMVVSALVLKFATPLLVRLGVYDTPNHRSSHEIATLRGAGIGPLAGFIVGLALALIMLEPSGVHLVSVLLAGSTMGLLGLIEDLRGVSAGIRATFQFAVGLTLALMLPSMGSSLWLWVTVAPLAFASYVNFTNFMDGVNGISGLHALVVGGLFTVLGMLADLPWVQVAGLVVALAFAAFLPWNLRSPGMFLGDVGSYLLGGALASIAVGMASEGIDLFPVISIGSIYIADATVTILSRAYRREPIFEAHRCHVYQRLTDAGMAHVSVSLLVASFTLLNGIVGIFQFQGKIPTEVAILIVVMSTLAYLLLPRFGQWMDSRRLAASDSGSDHP